MRNGKPIGQAIGFLMVLAAPIWAAQVNNTNASKTTAGFLSVNPSVKAQALGGNQLALKGSLNDLYSNPAGLAPLAIPELYFAHYQSFSDINYNTLSFGLPLQKSALAFTAQYVDFGSIERTGVQGGTAVLNQGELNPSNLAFNLTWARSVVKEIRLGFNAKAWREDRDTESSSSWATDLGLQVPTGLRGLDLGAVYRNLGPTVDGHSLPASGAIGGSYQLPFSVKPLDLTTLYSEYEIPNEGDARLRAGLELKQRYFWLGLGWQDLTTELEESLAQFSFGAGLRLKGWQLDYAWKPSGILEDEHRIAVTIGFGLTQDEQAAAARNLELAMGDRMKEKARNYHAQGIQYLKTSQYEKAVESFQVCLQWDPLYSKAKQDLILARSKFKFQQAQTFYEKGQKLSRKNQWLEAAFYWEKTLGLVPTHKKAQARLNVANRKLATRKKSSSAYEVGIRRYLKGDFKGALQAWEKVDRRNVKVSQLGEYIQNAKRMILEKEVAALKESKENTSKRLEQLNQKAYTLYYLGSKEEAVAMWKKVLALDPQNNDARASLNDVERLAQEAGDRGVRVTRVREVTDLNTQALQAYSNGNVEQAASLWKKALRLDPGNNWIQNNLTRVENELHVNQTPSEE